MVNPYAQRYTQVQTSTIGPEQLLLLLYEGAIRFLGQARAHLGEGRIGPGKTALSKAVAIVAELQNSMNFEAGWDGAEDLSHLYGHMLLELTRANVDDDPAPIDAVAELLSGLYGAWKQAIASVTDAPPAPEGAPDANGERAPFRVSA